MSELRGIWRHYKGHIYEVLGVANYDPIIGQQVVGTSKHSETLVEVVVYGSAETGVVWTHLREEVVVYRRLGTGELWVRPLPMWHETVGDFPRFERLTEAAV